ncbi:armadillo-type protein [Polychytrium aggregatum]|uniref:armadillo-type protein n=1 Tax=Polychytrium aggregatum TaxID=110093 RepID=UPI0022FEA2D6|nr:armadillo-type protein [Polychytrium aggregatum]KAI9207903.1 armadillo-type protein [Polychytrium aggregatum]
MSSSTKNPPPPQFKLKQRKREANAKYEPEVFRDSLLALIPEDLNDISQFAVILENNAEKLDYKRYGEPFFEIVICGGLIAPGGIIEEDGARLNPFSIFAAEDSRESIFAVVDVINKLVRRLKYLQRKLEDTLSHLLQYINKFGEAGPKLSRAVGMMAAHQLISLAVLSNTTKEHLVKEGSALEFVTGVFKAYLEEQSMENLSQNMKKIGLDDKLMEFFPLNKRGGEYLARHFEAEGLKALVEYDKKRQQQALKEELGQKLTLMFQENKTQVEIATFLKQQVAAHSWTEADVTPLLWQSLIAAIDWSGRAEQMEPQLVKVLGTWPKVFAMYCQSAKTELLLLTTVQKVCYEDARFLKHFKAIVANLYEHDVVSEGAILYWFERGATSHGKTVFLKQLEPFVQWLKEQEDDDEEDDE